jgi:hypothetical protein
MIFVSYSNNYYINVIIVDSIHFMEMTLLKYSVESQEINEKNKVYSFCNTKLNTKSKGEKFMDLTRLMLCCFFSYRNTA